MYIENTDCSVKSSARLAVSGVVPCCDYKIPCPRGKELDNL